ncbi:PREDICTED: A disintegrin and metalloproteinase with thrombospondin motifs 12-like [Thamnophis sirtalis]|uniref:A disintegrin and metalloproteinase with thrombospondin motifs 12-like n=1 Tax=Thamnophis sirtalis TaxID=35019 RepID=A0A6I9YCA2_9SAUR|nr:PREDICTED: A disintegrin and metalloproteinase with thrombospondin motifs 12-like [Thamnophis sirtalis]
MKWERNRVTPRTTYRRSVSRERWVETLVVADSKMIEYHGSENVESYILTIINMVAGLFHDPSIGNAIHIVLVRLILLEEEEQGLKITHHADKTLASFCKWQKSINPKLDTNPLHHDVAVLLTRKDICAGMNQPCETLGLSHLSGMCQPHRSCNINEDSGLPLAFTIAHELGHRFPRVQETVFAAQQGMNIGLEQNNICQTLWCFVKGSCRSKLDAAADGTRCGENKWCFSGECITVGKSPEAINGAWGSWSPWSHCTRTCGAGIQAAERDCNNPEPQFGGKYCTGERKHYRMCNVKGCQKSTPNFRQMQCSEFDTVAYKNEFYQWIPVYNTVNPCELQCRPTSHNFSEKMLDAVIDGTPCFEGNSFRDVCINGMCKTVGCDYEINSNATEDQCGVCLGDGSSCQTVKITFNQSEGLGYVDIGLIPKGALWGRYADSEHKIIAEELRDDDSKELTKIEYENVASAEKARVEEASDSKPMQQQHRFYNMEQAFSQALRLSNVDTMVATLANASSVVSGDVADKLKPEDKQAELTLQNKDKKKVLPTNTKKTDNRPSSYHRQSFKAPEQEYYQQRYAPYRSNRQFQKPYYLNRVSAPMEVPGQHRDPSTSLDLYFIAEFSQ